MKVIQWNLCKADIIGAKNVSALYRFFLRWFYCKAKQSVPCHTVHLMKVSALLCGHFIEIPQYFIFLTLF